MGKVTFQWELRACNIPEINFDKVKNKGYGYNICTSAKIIKGIGVTEKL